jgi:CheY-like chemotaxis protein
MIDDDAAFLDVAPWLLGGYGCRVETAGSAASGLAAARARRPDLMIIDFNMPGINGFELIESLRRDEALSSVPRIIVSGSGRLPQLGGLLRWEAVALLAKPVRRDAFVGAVKSALGGRLGEGALVVETGEASA